VEDLGLGGSSAQYRALYYLGSQMAMALTEFVDEEGTTPQATWTVTTVDLQPYSQMAERFTEDAIWGIIQFTETPGGAFLLVQNDAARTLLGLPQNRPFAFDENEDGLFNFLSRVSDLYGQTWSDIAVLEPQLGLFPMAPEIDELHEVFMGLSPSTPLVVTAFRVNVPGQPLARVTLAIPQPYLIPLAQSLEAAAEMTYLNGKDDAIEERLDHLGDVPVPIQVTLGSTQMALADLQNLEEEDLIVLDQPVGSPLPCDLGGARIWVKPGTSPDGLRRAVQVVSLGSE